MWHPAGTEQTRRQQRGLENWAVGALPGLAKRSGEPGTWQHVALQFGPSYTWCRGNFTFVNSNSTATTEVDMLAGFACDLSTQLMHDMRAIRISSRAAACSISTTVRAEDSRAFPLLPPLE